MRTSAEILIVAALVRSYTVCAFAQEALLKELYSKLGVFYQQGRYAEAAKVAEEALTIAENTFGPNHPHMATSLSNLAELYKVRVKYAEAESFHNRALKIIEKTLGPDHPWVSTVCENMAELYRRLGKED